MNSNCEYVDDYTDAQTEESKEYRCDRPRIANSTYCEFHDSDYFRTHEDIVRASFQNELYQTQNLSGSILFIGCNIPSIRIWNVRQYNIDFTHAKFHGDVSFTRMECRAINFSEAEFHEKFIALKIDVSEKFLFSKVRLKSKVEFKMCNFNSGDFSLTNFQLIELKDCELGHTMFRGCTFEKGISLTNCVLKDKTDFSACEFLEESKFDVDVFHSNALFLYSTFKSPIKFQNVDFKEQHLSSFGGDLSNVSFVRTDITRIKFDGDTMWGGNDGYTLFDARELKDNPSKSNLTLVLAVYRNLRENYEFRLMYEEAGQFFIKEMELKRIYYQDRNNNNTTKVKKWKRYFSVTNCYNILCNYGESFKRVSAWSIALFVSAFLYFFIFPDISELVQNKSLRNIDYVTEMAKNPFLRFETSLERTLGSFFHTGGGLADYVVRVASLPILGTMFIVLRRRFERRFRH